MFNIQRSPQNIFFSNKSFSKYLKDINQQKILLIHGQTFLNFKILEFIEKNIESKNLRLINTTKKDYLKYTVETIFNDFTPNIIISAGGGNIIDIAKMFVLISELSLDIKLYPFENQDINLDVILKYIDSNQHKIPNYKRKIEHICIVTKPGSGAESSKAMIINTKKGKKINTNNHNIPNSIFYFKKSFEGLGYSERMVSLLDAFTHIWESSGSPIKNDYVNFNSNYFTKNLEIEKIILNENFMDQCMTSFVGGSMQSESGTGLTHALAHSLEKNFHVSHPILITFSLPFAFLYWSKISFQNKKYLNFMSFKENFENAYINLVDRLDDETKKILNSTMNNIQGIDNLELSNSILEDSCARLTPQKLDINLLMNCLEVFKNKKWN